MAIANFRRRKFLPRRLLALDQVKVRVEPRAEWVQIFDEAWRINRDYFYATNYHGADWDAVKQRYQPLVAHAATGADVTRIIGWMASELAVGHSYSSDGDSIEDPAQLSVGLLGADYYIDILRRPFAAYWVMRYGDDLASPRGAVFGPKVMIADENAGSGGDLLPWMFQKYQLGPVVGTRTWGGLVGILGFPVLMDGGQITAPNLAIWNEDGWIVENVGVATDVEVVQWPRQVNAGADPQLEKAIELALEGLKKQPPMKPSRPPYPNRAGG